MSLDVILKDRTGADITYDASGGVSLLTPDNSRRLFYPASDDPGYITFSSPGAFTVRVDCVANQRNWNGTVQYSTDLDTWTDIPSKASMTTIASGADNKIYMRGYGNAYLQGDSAVQSDPLFLLTGSNISVSGNIASLLDADMVRRGVVPALGPHAYQGIFQNNPSLSDISSLVLPFQDLSYGCYQYMFQNCTGITVPPELPSRNLSGYCYEHMFAGCTSLTSTPELLAEKLFVACYSWMFYGCTGLTSVPVLAATELAVSCYSCMFYGCTGIVRMPELPATTIPGYAYSSMFSRCSSLKLSATQTGIYQYPFRMPTIGTGSAQSSSFTNMFTNTGGTFTGTPSVNTTYYTDHEPV